jgi:hypothetical protein
MLLILRPISSAVISTIGRILQSPTRVLAFQREGSKVNIEGAISEIKIPHFVRDDNPGARLSFYSVLCEYFLNEAVLIELL